MDIVPILSTIILVSTLITLIVAIASYMTFRIKEKKKQAALAEFSEVFSSDLAELQEASPVDNLPPVHTSQPVVATPPVVLQSPQSPAPITTGVVTPPVMMSAPVEPAAQPQPQPQTQQYGGHLSAVPGQQQAPAQDPYGMPYPNQQPPRTPQFTGAAAAFMKGFGNEPQPQQENTRQPPPPADYGQPPALRRFTPPDAKPRPQPQQSYNDDSPAWK